MTRLSEMVPMPMGQGDASNEADELRRSRIPQTVSLGTLR